MKIYYYYYIHTIKGQIRKKRGTLVILCSFYIMKTKENQLCFSLNEMGGNGLGSFRFLRIALSTVLFFCKTAKMFLFASSHWLKTFQLTFATKQLKQASHFHIIYNPEILQYFSTLLFLAATQQGTSNWFSSFSLCGSETHILFQWFVLARLVKGQLVQSDRWMRRKKWGSVDQ